MLVGRRAELGVVRSCVEEARPIVLVGPAGIGKSALARAALAEAGPFRQTGALATLTWAPLLLFRRLLREAPPDAPEAVAMAVLDQGSTPVLLDDLQWADDASLSAVAHLTGRVPLVMTVRTGEEASDRTLAALDVLGVAAQQVTGLSDEASARLAHTLHPGLDEDERRDLLARAQGSPLLLEQLPFGPDASSRLVGALWERRNAMDARAVAAMDRLAVLGRPASGAELGPGAHRLVEQAIAIEGPAGYELVHSLLGEVTVEALGVEADAVRRELAAVVGDQEAAHLLAATGDRAGARDRALRAARSGTRRERAESLALAVRCADDVDFENRVRACRMLTSVSEPAQARALAGPPERDDLPPVQRGALLAVEAEAAWLAGDQRTSVELVERALADLRGTRTGFEVAALAGSTVAQTFIDVDGRPALERAREAVRLADEIKEEQRYARTRLASVLLTAGEPGWQDLLDEAIAESVAKGDDDTRRTAVVSYVLGCWVTGDSARGEAVALAEVERGSRQAYDVTWLTTAAYAAVLGLVRGRSRTEIADRFGPLLGAWPTFRSRRFMEAAVALALGDHGDHADALDATASALEAADAEPQWRSIALWARAEALWLAGRPADVLAVAAAVRDLGIAGYPAVIQTEVVAAHAAREVGAPIDGPAPSSPFPAWRPATDEHAGIAAAAGGDTDEAVFRLLRAADGWLGTDVRSEARCRWAAGDVAAIAGRADAVDLLDTAVGLADEIGLRSVADRARHSLRRVGVVRTRPPSPGPGGLTAREREVVERVGRSMTSAQIAASLGLEVSTVESNIRQAMRKLGVTTRVAAAARLAQLSEPRPPSG